MKVLNDHMEQYYSDLGMVLDHEFWKKFGYSKRWNEMPLNDRNYVKLRLNYTKIYFQCDKCLKWRPQCYENEFSDLENYPPDNWCCENGNGDITCDKLIELEPFKLSELKQKPKPIEEESNVAPSTSTKSNINSFNGKSRNDAIMMQVLRRNSESLNNSYDSRPSHKENREASTGPKQKRKSQDEDSEPNGRDTQNKPKQRIHRDHSYTNSYVDRNRSASNAKKPRSDQLEVIKKILSLR